MPVIAVDAGGTHLRLGVADDAGGIRMFARRQMPNSRSGADDARVWGAILDLIAGYVQTAEAQIETGDAITLAVPGPVVAGRLISAPTIVGERDHIPDIAGLLAARTRRSVHLVNDVSAAAWHLGATMNCDRFIVVTVSSGIGSKLFDRHHPDRVLDAGAYAGEIGHLVVDEGARAPTCDCGGRGHLGAIASGRGTERLARRLARAERARFQASPIAKTVLSPDAISNEEHLIPAALCGDGWARSVIERAARPLARVLAAIVASAGVDRIVVIGGFAQRLGGLYGEMLAAHLATLLDARSFARLAGNGVHVCDDGEEVCLAGAAAFYRTRRHALV